MGSVYMAELEYERGKCIDTIRSLRAECVSLNRRIEKIDVKLKLIKRQEAKEYASRD